MGSHGDALLRCAGCDRPGRCLDPEYLQEGELSLIDVDGPGPMCDACFCAPFTSWVVMRWLNRKFAGAEVSKLIRSFVW